MSKKSLQTFLTFFFVVAFVIIFIDGFIRARNTSIQSSIVPVSSSQTGNTVPLPQQTSSTPPPTTPVASRSAHATPTPAPTRTPQPSVRTATGDAYQVPWGIVQVSVTVNGGVLRDVQTPQYPESFPSQNAQPYLIQEALSAGSANIQGVSGATYTSIAFQKSLESALVKAGM